MKIALDTHTHTLASGHAYNTINEMAEAASELGLEILAITEHAMAMPGTCHQFYFENLKVVPREMHGVRLMMGTEANIINLNGELDMPDYLLAKMDLVIASMHLPCVTPGTAKENTDAVIAAMKHPAVSIIGHPDDARIPMLYEPLVKAAKEYNVLLELNNSSLNPNGFRLNARDNDIEMLKLCKEYGVSITLGSDAHFSTDIANYNYAFDVLEEVDFPEELIANTDVEKFLNLLRRKRSDV
ncbi:MAG: phosphatase [bacterium]|nr:phosphatase [bacterium]